jgi:alkaline phosphatase D
VRRIAFGSCSNQYLAQPVWPALVATAPDLFLYQGDVIYGDAAPPGTRLLAPSIDQLEKLRLDYAFLGTQPDFVKVRETIPVMATWDDHDFGKNDGGADFELEEESRELFLDFFGEPSGSERRRTPGLHEARTFGLLEIDREAGSSPRIILSLISADGSVPLRHELSLDGLRQATDPGIAE